MNIYDSIIDAAQELPMAERGQLYTAAVEYLYFGRDPEFRMGSGARAVFVAMRPVLENQLSAKERGRKGGRSPKKRAEEEPRLSRNGKLNESSASEKGHENGKLNESSASEKGHENGKLNESEQEQEEYLQKELPCGSSKKRPKFSPPAEAEVSAYAAEAGISIDAGRFVDYHAAQGWRLSNGNVMRDWRAAARNWARRDRPRKGVGPDAESEYGW